MSPAKWTRIGHIERAGDGLKVFARAFGKETVGYITPEGVKKKLMQPGSMPAEVFSTRPGDSDRIGTAFRSRSGRGVIVHLIAAPEASGSWDGLRGVIAGTRDRVNISTLEEDEPSPDPVRPPMTNGGSLDLRAGLEMKF